VAARDRLRRGLAGRIHPRNPSRRLARGHLHCVKSVHHLADGCLDAFHNDVEASVRNCSSTPSYPFWI